MTNELKIGTIVYFLLRCLQFLFYLLILFWKHPKIRNLDTERQFKANKLIICGIYTRKVTTIRRPPEHLLTSYHMWPSQGMFQDTRILLSRSRFCCLLKGKETCCNAEISLGIIVGHALNISTRIHPQISWPQNISCIKNFRECCLVWSVSIKEMAWL